MDIGSQHFSRNPEGLSLKFAWCRRKCVEMSRVNFHHHNHNNNIIIYTVLNFKCCAIIAHDKMNMIYTNRHTRSQALQIGFTYFLFLCFSYKLAQVL